MSYQAKIFLVNLTPTELASCKISHICCCAFKQLPLSVERRLSKLCSNEKIFNDSIPIYQEALIKAGYNHKLTYQKYNQKKDNSQQHKRQIIWLNYLQRNNNMLNRRTAILNKCRHKNKYALISYDSKD